MINATSGPMSPGSSTSCSPNGSSSKTSQDTSASALKPCFESYGTWASRLRLAYSRRLKSARRMNGSGSSSWPTATAHSFAQTADNPTPGQTGGTTLAGAAELLWGTPRASDAEKGGPNQSFGAGGTPLPAQAAHWPTPAPMQTREGWTAEAIEEARALERAKGINGNGFGLGLGAAACIWPTPAARDAKGENSADHLINGTGRLHMDQLPNADAHGFSLPDHQTPAAGPMPFSLTRILHRLWADKGLFEHPRKLRAAFSPPSRKPCRNPVRQAWRVERRRDHWEQRRTSYWTKARLNPQFVEWLMGWPSGHALCDCSATAFSLWQQHMRGALSRLPTASGPWIWQEPVPTTKAVQLDLFGGV